MATGEIVKILKPMARKMYNAGYNILLLPCKVPPRIPPFGGWITPFEINLKQDSTKSFDSVVGEFKYYNCNNEVGYYAHYYVTMNDYDTYNKKV